MDLSKSLLLLKKQDEGMFCFFGPSCCHCHCLFSFWFFVLFCFVLCVCVSSTLFLNEVLTLVNHLVYILMISLVTCLICGGIPFVILCLIIISVFSFCFLVYVFVFNFFLMKMLRGTASGSLEGKK